MAHADGQGATAADVERRRRLAATGGRISPQDGLDWANALLRGGHSADARMLFQAMAVRQGFSPQLVAARSEMSADMGAAGACRAPLVDRHGCANTVELAIAELRALVRTLAPAVADSQARRPPRRRSAPGLHPTAVQRRVAAAPGEQPVAHSVAALFDWLGASDPDEGATARASASIDALRGVENDPTRFDAVAMAGAAPAVLAAAIAIQELRTVLRGNGDLLAPPLGSPALFHAAAGLDSAGLGPWFGNVPRIVRRSANVFELARIAVAEAAAVGLDVGEEEWAVLLGRNLTGGLLAEFVDDLGDRNAGAALRAMLDRTLALPADSIDRPLVWRLRDAGLDNLDYDLASKAQSALVKLQPHDMLERRILAQIDASNGHVMAAEQNFEACLHRDPDNAALRREMEANRFRRFAPFALVKGFGSPHDRQLKRLRLRGAATTTALPGTG